MFENIRKVLDEFENTFNDANSHMWNLTEDDESILGYLNLHLAKALMQEEYVSAESVAKIILAAKELSNEIVVKVQ
jgi:hypothetical protein